MLSLVRIAEKPRKADQPSAKNAARGILEGIYMPKIVLVDDEIWALRGLESLLQEYPEYTVAATFTNGQEALAYLRTHPCDVVFTDLHMDQMGGQQLIAACTQERIPVRMVIISAYSDFSAAREGLRSGVVDYLFKPITRKDMAALMARLNGVLQPEPPSSHIALQRAIENAYPECRVLSWDSADAATERAIASIDPAGFALGFSDLRVNGYSVALLSNPLGQLPPAILALPMRAGISLPQRDFSLLHDMIAQAQQSAQFAFRYALREPAGQIQAYLASHFAQPLTLDGLADHFFMNKAHLCSTFRENCGVTIMTFLKTIRMRMAARLLLETSDSVQDVAAKVGYPDSAYFSRVFKSTYKISPEAYRKKRPSAGNCNSTHV